MKLQYKIGLAIAPENALPSAFVVFHDKLETSIKKVADLGYDGVELALLDKNQVDIKLVNKLISDYGLTIPVVSTGQVYGEARLHFTDPDPARRQLAMDKFMGLMEVAAEFGAKINIGRIRGPLWQETGTEKAENNFMACLEKLSDFGRKLNVEIILEPVNRYEINFINNCAEGVRLLNRLGRENVKLMPDLFHMNIEDPSIEGTLMKYADYISYIHVADTNRYAPGRGHMDFKSIFTTLNTIRYRGFLSVEILPFPTPDAAALEAIQYLRKYC